MRALKYIFEYSKVNYDGNGIYELNRVCSEVMKMLGRLAFNNERNKGSLREIGLVDSVCNHPLIYLMDNELKAILIPALCAIMDENIPNMKIFLGESSAENIIKFI